MAAQYSLESTNLSLNRRDQFAFKEVDLKISSNQFIAFMGLLPIDQSLFLQTLSGKWRPSEGELFVFGWSIYQNQQLIKENVGYVPCEDIFDHRLTVEENFYFYARLFNVPQSEIRSRIDYVSGLFKLDSFLSHFVSELNAGISRRVSIARAILTKPKLLVIDEPTRGVDSSIKKWLLQTIKIYQKEQDASIIVGSQDFFSIEEVCDQVGFFHKAKLVRFESLALFLKNRDQISVIEFEVKAEDRHYFSQRLQEMEIDYRILGERYYTYCKSAVQREFIFDRIKSRFFVMREYGLQDGLLLSGSGEA